MTTLTLPVEDYEEATAQHLAKVARLGLSKVGVARLLQLLIDEPEG